MTIIHIAGGLGGGGAEQMVLQLAKNSQNTFDTRVFALANISELEPKFKENKIYYRYLNINSFKNKSFWSGLLKMHNDIKDKDDIIFHCHQFHSVLFALLYKVRYRSFPIVFTLHSSVIEEMSRKVFLFLTKPFRNIDIIFSSNATSWFLKNSLVIPNGIDFIEYQHNNKRNFNSNNIFKFLYAGRLSPEKNPLALIEIALKLINHNQTNFVINVLGIGILEHELIKRIKINNLEKHIIIHGFQSDVKPYLNECQCLLLPSLWEGMPVILIEAAAAKLPIITTSVGSIPDFIDNTNATLCNLEQFPNKMSEIMKNYKVATDKSEKLYEKLKLRFNINSVYQQHIDCYQNLNKKV